MEISMNEEIEQKVIDKLKTIQDNELPINIYDLGLIYKIKVKSENNSFKIYLEMTLINSRCNSTKSFTEEIINSIKSINNIDECKIEFVFTPKWEVTMITPAGLELLRNAN